MTPLTEAMAIKCGMSLVKILYEFNKGIEDPAVLEKLRQVIAPPVGIAKEVSVSPKKKEFVERAWFNGFQEEKK